MTRLQAMRLQLKDEILSADIFDDTVKEDIVNQLMKELRHVKSTTWFNCKMILWKNRYDTVGKDRFFQWLYTTHLKEYIELKQGGNEKND